LRYANPDNLSTSSVERIRYSTYDQYLSASKMVLTPDDGWIFAGGVIGSHNLPGGVGLAQTGTGQPDVFVLEADASGDVLWARSFDVTQGAFVKGVARDSAGNVIVVGTLLQGSILKLGEGALELVAQTSGPFIFKLASDGTPLWARLVATAGDDNGEGVTLIGDDIFFAGRATGQLEAGGDPHHGSGDIFVMRLTP
jgi:hypothetical protein